MLMGHYSAAFVAKAVAPRTPLFALFIAVQFVDILWASFILAGVEHARLDPSLRSNALVLYHMPYTHSLLATLGWSLLAGAVAALFSRKRGEAFTVGVAVGTCVLSHFVLDALVHRPDLIVFGYDKIGLSLWNYPIVALLLEVCLLGASFLWLWSAHPTSRSRALALFAGVMLVAQIVSTVGPQPPTVTAIAASVLATFIVLACAVGWIERRFSAGEPFA